VVVEVVPRLGDVIAVDRALAKLETLNARLARVVECRYFAGMNIDETAEALARAPATVKRDWVVARVRGYPIGTRRARVFFSQSALATPSPPHGSRW